MDKQAIEAVLHPLKAEYAFYFHRTGTEPVLVSNQPENHQFMTASVIKVPILLAWIALERQQLVSADAFCEAGDEPVVTGAGFFYLFRQKKLTWHDVLLLMIATSDNYCTNLVISHLGLERINRVFADLGFQDTHLGRKMMTRSDRASGKDNWIITADLIRCFDLIQNLPVTEKTFAEEMLLSCQADRLFLRNLPGDSVDFFHKSGGLDNVMNEWGYTADRRIFLMCNNFEDHLAVLNVFGTFGQELLA
jgi:beta-lactamase class A